MQFLDPKIDVAFKMLFGSDDKKNLTMAFLNAILEYKGDQRIVEIEFMNSEQLPLAHEKKDSILDVICKDRAGRRFIIEMQNAWEAGFVKRIQWYGARTYAHQLNSAKPYVQLDPIVVVAITKNFILFPQKEAYKSIHEFRDRVTGEHDLGDFTFAFVELKKFKKAQQELVSNEDKWLFLLRDIALYNHIPEALQEAEFRQACESLDRWKWPEDKYAQYEKSMLDTQAAEETARRLLKAEQSLQERDAKDQEKERSHVRRMLSFNCELLFIAQVLDMSLKEVQKIAAEIKDDGSPANDNPLSGK